MNITDPDEVNFNKSTHVLYKLESLIKSILPTLNKYNFNSRQDNMAIFHETEYIDIYKKELKQLRENISNLSLGLNKISEKVIKDYVVCYNDDSSGISAKYPETWMLEILKSFMNNLKEIPYNDFLQQNYYKDYQEFNYSELNISHVDDMEQNEIGFFFNNIKSYIKLPEIEELINCINWVTEYQTVYSLIDKEIKSLHQKPPKPKSEDIIGFKCNIEPQLIENLFAQLKGVYIDEGTNQDFFKAIFRDEIIPNEFINEKIHWKQSIPLFCCLFFGYKQIEYSGEFFDFDGVFSKSTIHFYKKAVELFSFDSRKVTNKTLSEKNDRLTDSKAPQNFDNLYPIIKTVQNSTS